MYYKISDTLLCRVITLQTRELQKLSKVKNEHKHAANNKQF